MSTPAMMLRCDVCLASGTGQFPLIVGRCAHVICTYCVEGGCPLCLDAAGRSERCERCGGAYTTVWHASDALWQQVTGHQAGEGLLCPACFEVLARLTGRTLYWEAADGHFPTDDADA